MPLQIRRPCQETSNFIHVYLHGSDLVILFCFSSEDYSDRSGSFFPSLEYVFHWKVVDHLKLLFLVGSGIFLASLTLFVSLWWYLSLPAIFYSLSVIVLHILCPSPVCFRAFVISSRKLLNSKRTRNAGKCLLPPFQLAMGLDSTGNCTLNQSAHANYLRKSPGQDFYPEIQRLNEFRIHQNNLHTWIWYLRVISRWLLCIRDTDLIKLLSL